MGMRLALMDTEKARESGQRTEAGRKRGLQRPFEGFNVPCCPLGYALGGNVAMDSPHVGHGGRPDQHDAHPEQTTHWQLIITEGTFQGSNRGLDGSTQIAAVLPIFRDTSAASGDLSIMPVEGECPLRLALQFARRALVFESTTDTLPSIKAGQISFVPFPCFNRYGLAMRAGDLEGHILVRGGDLELV